MKIINRELLVIGGGPAGLAAAVGAYEEGIRDILILERDIEAGGILNQCIHNGFGLHTFKEELTGPEYAGRYIDKVNGLGIEIKTNSMVIDLKPVENDENKDSYGNLATVVSRSEGMYQIKAKAVILAMGCRERPRGALNIPGFRPAGVFSAGTAQRLVNIEGKNVGKDVVILGSGDIGLIMARRMSLEGARVHCVLELMPYSGGLKRNIVQCLEDYSIPLHLSHTVIDVKGKERVTSIVAAQVDENLQPIPGTEKEYKCDTLLLSVGLIPENEVSLSAGIEISPITNGPVVDEAMETSCRGVFACGNVLHVHDLVDYVSDEADVAGRKAAAFIRCQGEEVNTKGHARHIETCGAVRYVVPQEIHSDNLDDEQIFRFRVSKPMGRSKIVVSIGDKTVMSKNKMIMAPGEMETITFKKKWLEGTEADDKISISAFEIDKEFVI